MKKTVIAVAALAFTLTSCEGNNSFSYIGEPGIELSSRDDWKSSFDSCVDVTADISTETSYYIASGSERENYETSSETTFKIDHLRQADVIQTLNSSGASSTTEIYVRRVSAIPTNIAFTSTIIVDGQSETVAGSVLNTDSFKAYEDLYDETTYQEDGYYLIALPEQDKQDFFFSFLGALDTLPGYTIEYDFSQMNIEIAIAFDRIEDGSSRPIYVQEWAYGEIAITASASGQSIELTCGIDELNNVYSFT